MFVVFSSQYMNIVQVLDSKISYYYFLRKNTNTNKNFHKRKHYIEFSAINFQFYKSTFKMLTLIVECEKKSLIWAYKN